MTALRHLGWCGQLGASHRWASHAIHDRMPSIFAHNTRNNVPQIASGLARRSGNYQRSEWTA